MNSWAPVLNYIPPNRLSNLKCLFICFSPFLHTVFDISQVLAGEEADITPSMLNTADADTPAEELVYNIEAPTNGILALKEAPEESLLNFTQAHINRGEVIFVHEGEATRLRVKHITVNSEWAWKHIMTQSYCWSLLYINLWYLVTSAWHSWYYNSINLNLPLIYTISANILWPFCVMMHSKK